jgi:hypothetical protein
MAMNGMKASFKVRLTTLKLTAFAKFARFGAELHGLDLNQGKRINKREHRA